YEEVAGALGKCTLLYQTTSLYICPAGWTIWFAESSMPGQVTVNGGMLFGTCIETPFMITVSSILLPSITRSKTRSNCVAAGGTTFGNGPSVAVEDQICVCTPPRRSQ